jgi:hypothetical protein
MDLNLDTMKREVMEYLEHSEFAVFRSAPGDLDDLPLVLWDVEGFPDFQMFLEAARKIGVKMIVFAAREFTAREIDDAVEELDECDLTREERRDMESRLRALRAHEGVTCSIELAFDHNARMYVYEIRTDWYDEFLSIGDEIGLHLPTGRGSEDDDGPFGYFSNN